jgi:hypothetical protein
MSATTVTSATCNPRDRSRSAATPSRTGSATASGMRWNSSVRPRRYATPTSASGPRASAGRDGRRSAACRSHSAAPISRISGSPELEQLVRIQADAGRVQREGPALQVLDAEEADRLVERLLRSSDQEGQPADQCGRHGDDQPAGCAEQRHPERRRAADLQPEHRRQPGEHPRHDDAARRQQQSPEPERQRRRVRPGPLGNAIAPAPPATPGTART